LNTTDLGNSACYTWHSCVSIA